MYTVLIMIWIIKNVVKVSATKFAGKVFFFYFCAKLFDNKKWELQYLAKDKLDCVCFTKLLAELLSILILAPPLHIGGDSFGS